MTSLLATHQPPLILYVDDTTLHYPSPSVTELNINIQRGANALFSWSTPNKTVIPPQKSKITILGSQRKLEGTEEYLNVTISGKTVINPTVTVRKYWACIFRLLSDVV